MVYQVRKNGIGRIGDCSVAEVAKDVGAVKFLGSNLLVIKVRIRSSVQAPFFIMYQERKCNIFRNKTVTMNFIEII